MTQASPMERYPAEVYDWLTGSLTADLRWWLKLASEAKGPRLEVACGTGRVLLEVARAGHEVTGLDLDRGMLARLRTRLKAEPAAVRQRVRIARGDMRDFKIDGRFALAYMPFNAFLHLMTPEDQERALVAIRRHLRPGGRFALAIFDPAHDLLSEREHTGLMGAPVRVHTEEVDAKTGERLLVFTVRRTLDHDRQTLRELWCFERFDREGRSIERRLWPLELRWTFPQEMRYLFRLTGFEVEDLRGGFGGEPFRHPCQQLWVARRPGK